MTDDPARVLAERPPREALPTDAAELAPLSEAFADALDSGLSALGVELEPFQREAIEIHARLLLAWNRHINLTAIRDEAEVARLHVLDSLSAVALLRSAAPGGRRLRRMVDLGSGGGYPGLPLAISGVSDETLLLDSVGKKVRFLETAAVAVSGVLADAAAGPNAARPNAPLVRAERARAEDLAAGSARASFDAVVARAVGTLAEVAELGLPLLRERGLLVVWKRDESGLLGREIAESLQLVRACGGETPRRVPVSLESLPGHVLVTVRKAARTPARFPRPPATRRLPC